MDFHVLLWGIFLAQGSHLLESPAPVGGSITSSTTWGALPCTLCAHSSPSRQPRPPHRQRFPLPGPLLLSPNTLCTYCVLSTVLATGDGTPSCLTLLGQESARSQVSAAADNYGHPTLGPFVHLFLPPLCLSSSAHKAHDLISPHPNLPSASRPSSCHLLRAAPQEPSSSRQPSQTSHSAEPCEHSGYSGAQSTIS